MAVLWLDTNKSAGNRISIRADWCGYGEKLAKIYNAHQIAEQLVAETLLKFKTEWLKTEMQMAFLKKIALLGVLETKLHEAVNLLDGIIGAKTNSRKLSFLLAKNGAIRKGQYAVHVKDSLDKTVVELIEWRGLFDPSWYLLARLADDTVDWSLRAQSGSHKVTLAAHDDPFKLLIGLRKSVHDLNTVPHAHEETIRAEDFLGPRIAIPHSSIMTAHIEGHLWHGVVDSMPLNPKMDASKTAHSVKALTRVLNRMDPATFSLLRCCGVINKVDTYEFVFEIPDGCQSPRSLRALLLDTPLSLNERIAFARQLAKSVFYLHAAGFVHKNIRPENILVFDHIRDGIKSSFLFGFESFRGIKEETFKTGDVLPERDLYRHPSRQGNDPERPYEMKHDIYSLGVCLLEIGFWRSFVKSEEGKSLIEFLPMDDRDVEGRACTAKTGMLMETNRSLSQCTGQKFKDVVEKCLTCLDDDSTWDEVDNNRVEEIGVGVEFIENVLLQLHEIAV